MKKVEDISLLLLVFALLVFVGTNIVQDYSWKEKTVEMQTQIEELKTQIETMQSETQEVDYQLWTEEEWEIYLDEIEIRFKELEQKQLDNYQTSDINRFYIESVQNQLRELRSNVYSKDAELGKRLQELEIYYHSQYFEDELMTANLVRRSGEYILVMDIEEGIVTKVRLYSDQGWEDVEYNQSVSPIYWGDYLEVISEMDSMLDMIEYLGGLT